MSRISTHRIYDNFLMLDDEGEFLAYIDKKRFDWYLKKELADHVGPTTIRLKFKPKGPGKRHDSFYSSKQENKCVACGKEQELTRHHIVPYCYRRFFPTELKQHSSHDVLPVCRYCHTEYELQAEKLKRKILEELHIDPTEERYQRILIDKSGVKYQGMAKGLIDNWEQLDVDVEINMLVQLEEFLGKQIQWEDVKELSEANYRTLNENYICTSNEVVNRVDLYDFVVRWRKHFVDTMLPEYMPKHWDIYKPIGKDDTNDSC